ncbi:hypothetical protein EJB05_10824 [Eragrostis curvula]|uniref:COX VIIa-like protein n=1 Tax=Eragrostis curvula TaxID=38414 RepID=A0A5J9VP03_9POAL|nr:hypothetical protein EJB05_10824 [Eragrostis curvula]
MNPVTLGLGVSLVGPKNWWADHSPRVIDHKRRRALTSSIPPVIQVSRSASCLPQIPTLSAAGHRVALLRRQDDRSTILPRERLFKQQNYFQNLTKHTYLKGRYDVITSVAIPLALAASSMFMIGRGVYNMSHGIGKKE